MSRLPAPGTAREAVDEAVPDHAVGAASEADSGASLARASTPSRPSRSRWAIAGVVALIAVPLVVALVALTEPRWYPVIDLAQTEMRLRDITGGDPPLIGLAGRIGPLGEQGSHPGPLSFYALWPVYQLFGASAWALQAAAASLHVIAIGLALWIAHRRGGVPVLVGMAATVAVLLRAYGAGVLTEAWNPYMPVTWWLVFLLAVWSILCDDLPMLPVAVVAGTFCMQTHISYMGLVAGLGGLTLVAIARRGRGRAVVAWVSAAVIVGVVLWLPPVIDQLTADTGNLTRLWDYFGHPPEAVIGPGDGFELLLAHLNPAQLVTADLVAPRFAERSVIPGAALLLAFAASAIVSWRLRQHALVRLHLVIGAALVLGAVTTSRIFGYVWYYLTFWAWGVCALMVVAVVWTACAFASRGLRSDDRARVARAGAALLVGVTVVTVTVFAVEAASVDVVDEEQSEALAAVTPSTVSALSGSTRPGEGPDGSYLVSWEIDPVGIGSQGYGLVNELERAGFDVGVVTLQRAGSGYHRERAPAESSAIVHLAVGSDIDVWRAKPGARQVAFVEPRSSAGRAEFDRLRGEVIDGLRAAGLGDLVAGFERAPFAAALDPRVPERLHARMLRMLELGLPTAVFVAPPSTLG